MSVNLHKVTLNLREGDWDYLTSIYTPNGLATSVVVRNIVSNFVDKLRAKEAELSKSDPHNFDIEL